LVHISKYILFTFDRDHKQTITKRSLYTFQIGLSLHLLPALMVWNAVKVMQSCKALSLLFDRPKAKFQLESRFNCYGCASGYWNPNISQLESITSYYSSTI